jgi:hypothetical protein
MATNVSATTTLTTTTTATITTAAAVDVGFFCSGSRGESLGDGAGDGEPETKPRGRSGRKIMCVYQRRGARRHSKSTQV